MKTYLRHKILNVIDIKELAALEYLDFEGKYREYVEKHSFWEICFVEKGEVILTVEGEKRTLLQGDIIFISPDSTHSYFSEKGNKSRAFVICFECFSQPVKTLGGMRFSLRERNLDTVRSIIDEYKHTFSVSENDLLEVLPEPNFGGQQAIIIQLEYLIICLLRELSEEKNPEVVFLNKERFYADLAGIIIDYFRENIGKKLSVEDICNKVGYSSSFLCKTFKEQTGETLFTYFNRMKIERAKKLLEETPMTISAVSHELGFSETKYFSASFKKIVGVTPTLYRENLKKERKI